MLEFVYATSGPERLLNRAAGDHSVVLFRLRLPDRDVGRRARRAEEHGAPAVPWDTAPAKEVRQPPQVKETVADS